MLGAIYEFNVTTPKLGVCIALRDWDRAMHCIAGTELLWVNRAFATFVGTASFPYVLAKIEEYNKANPDETIEHVRERRLLKRSNEFMQTVKLADFLLNEAGTDPDDSLRTLSRQFLRQVETIHVLLAEAYTAWHTAADQAAARLEPVDRERQRIEQAVKLARKNMWGFSDEETAAR